MSLSFKADSITAFSESSIPQTLAVSSSNGDFSCQTHSSSLSPLHSEPKQLVPRGKRLQCGHCSGVLRGQRCVCPHHCSGDQPKAQHAHICSSKFIQSQMCLRDSAREKISWWEMQGVGQRKGRSGSSPAPCWLSGSAGPQHRPPG